MTTSTEPSPILVRRHLEATAGFQEDAGIGLARAVLARAELERVSRSMALEAQGIEVTEEATDDFYAAVDEALGPTVWNTGCNSWYFTDSGNIDLFPFDRKAMTRMLSKQIGRAHV